jgi:hypothetical protein
VAEGDHLLRYQAELILLGPTVPLALQAARCGPSMAGGWSSFIVSGPSLSWPRMGRSAFLTGGALVQGISDCPGRSLRPRKGRGHLSAGGALSRRVAAHFRPPTPSWREGLAALDRSLKPHHRRRAA